MPPPVRPGRRDSASVDEAMEAMEQHTGTVPGYRRAHPRGVSLRGHFTAAPEVARLTVAEHLQGERLEVVARLSNAAGSPYAPDRKSPSRGTTLGLGVRFALPSGGHATWAAPNLENFPARTPRDFVRITHAQRPGPRTQRPDPLRLLAYAAAHPYALHGLKSIAGLPAPESFATVRFHGLHAYFLVGPDGGRRAFRYSWVPEAGTAALGPDAEREALPQYLTQELAERLRRQPIAWRLEFQLADAGDPVDDITRQWPADRETLTAGRLELDRLHEDQEAADLHVYDPTRVPAGIECSDDPILHYRSQVYAESYRRRTRETRPPAPATS